MQMQPRAVLDLLVGSVTKCNLRFLFQESSCLQGLYQSSDLHSRVFFLTLLLNGALDVLLEL